MMMKNDKLMTMKKTGLQYALRTSKMGTGATFPSLPPPLRPSKPQQRLNLKTFSKPSSGYQRPLIVVDQDPSVLL